MEKQDNLLPEDCGYRIVRHLGSGGEGSVYLVCQLSTCQLRAAKIISHIKGDSRHELNMMKNLNHPSLPGIIDVLEMDKDVWLIMDYINGTRLDTAVSEGMSEKQVWSVARQLSNVLFYLHGRKTQILHLDIKPSNILLRQDGSLVLIDFGAAIRGHPGQDSYLGYGTRGFAAPEQYKKEGKVDVRTDIYGAGAVLYYCIYGKVPGSDKQVKRLGKTVSRRLLRIIHTCMSENPNDRYQNAQQFYKAVCEAENNFKMSGQFYKTAAVTLLLLVTVIFAFARLSVHHQSDFALWNELSGTLDLEQSENETVEWVETDALTSDTIDAEKEYIRLLEMAVGMGLEQASECFRNAAVLFPADGKWYLSLIEWVTADGLFELEEETVVKELIYMIPSGNDATALELLKASGKEYGYVAFRIGLAYWYYYEGSGGKSAAAGWFNRAVSSQTEDSTESWLTQATILARIASYYGMLGGIDTNEEREEMEWEYWKDLKELWYLYLEGLESTAICSETAGELLAILILQAYELQQYGESGEEMIAMVESIKEFLADDSIEGLEKEREMLEEQCAAAYSSIERLLQSET
ncbi:MAG: serine/threonine protein kinase [Lachnospiraceae bacterium]|nr:serine/threonine protein kinase [Lachnospiraceae bacterium]